MTPTNELRFVEREVITAYGNAGAQVAKTVRVLQQKWMTHHIPAGQSQASVEWRDVPLVGDHLCIQDPAAIRAAFEADDFEGVPV